MSELHIDGQFHMDLPDNSIQVVQKADHYWKGFITGLITGVLGVAAGVAAVLAWGDAL